MDGVAAGLTADRLDFAQATVTTGAKMGPGGGGGMTFSPLKSQHRIVDPGAGPFQQLF